MIPGRGDYLADGDTDEPVAGHVTDGPGRNNLVLAAPSSAPASTARRLRRELLERLNDPTYDRVDLLVSFVKRSGVELIAEDLVNALERNVRVRLLTTDYLGITDTDALGLFLDRMDDWTGRLSVKVFSDPSTSFHPKAYIFAASTTGDGVAFVGSSNLSRSGISTGVEWNIHTTDIDQMRDEFQALWDDPRSVDLSPAWLLDYDGRRAEQLPAAMRHAAALIETDSVPAEIGAAAADEDDRPPEPWSVQAEALAALEAARVEGRDAGLVVMATGLGKTWLAAFDTDRPEFGRVLFIAHEETILRQARDVFRRMRPTAHLTMFTGKERDPNGEVVFATIQSLHRNLAQFAPDDFDYIVVDEFHHAAARSYRRTIAHVDPRFLLGLTATPDRADAADLLVLCGDNLVYECGLVRGIQRDLLSPFRYRAIPDVADYQHIPWRSRRFDPDELTKELSTLERARQVHDEWIALGGTSRRSLGFCSTIAHADFMTEQFRALGVRSAAVHSGPDSLPRSIGIERLEAGDLDILFTVDMFNEGVDIPTVDSVFMLRPTESPVVFFQQLGRGLRRSDGKDRLEIIDLVGNHRSFLLKARLLAMLAGRTHMTEREAVEYVTANRDDLAGGSPDLPPGCSIILDPEVVDLLAKLAGPGTRRDGYVDFVRQWIDDHDGRRPTLMELSLLAGEHLDFRSDRGWFAFLNGIGALTDSERDVLASVSEFLRWIETGNYSKSYKLVTLRALVDSGQMRDGIPVPELAELCRREILRDSDLVEDLDDAQSSFVDRWNPTSAEWLPYWRKNPIHAITTASRGSDPWFEIDDQDVLRMTRRVDEPDDATLAAMVAELVEYRLHRYLAQRAAKRTGESRKFLDDNGVEIDATFTVESRLGRPTAVVIESSGGTRGSDSARNLDYVAGFDLALGRLQQLDVHLADVYVDTTRTKDLPLSQRRLTVDGVSFPIDLAEVGDLIEFRKALLRSMSKVGQAPGASGGGNARKRTRLVIAVDGWSAAGLADALVGG